MVNTKQKDEIKFAAFMGIDWADQTHAWALEQFSSRSSTPSFLVAIRASQSWEKLL
jgi:hypothetical protein